MPETATKEYTSQHLCGFPVRIRIELTNIKVTHLRQGVKLAEAEMSYKGKVTYYRLNENEPITYCPGCGRNFPKVGD